MSKIKEAFHDEICNMETKEPMTNNVLTDSELQADAVVIGDVELTWPDNIVADRHETTGKWVLWYLTDEQAVACNEAIRRIESGEV